MRFQVITLFPDMILQYATESILGRALKQGAISVETINIRDFSTNKHHRVDDYPYGGGAGMVLEAEPVYQAICHAIGESGQSESESPGTERTAWAPANSGAKSSARSGRPPRVIYMTPQAPVLTQAKVEELALEEELILLCGHYEGIDERVLDECVTDYISIGDYVLTGGELGAMVVMDAVSRFVPGVLGNEASADFESMQDQLLEYPHYTRPEIWREKEVPSVLLSGDHKKIEAWRLAASMQRTKERRPDLLAKHRTFVTIQLGDVENLAAGLDPELSRYGIRLDYNRRKLQKEYRVITKDEQAIFVLDKALLEDEAQLKKISKLHGDSSECVLLWVDEEETKPEVPALKKESWRSTLENNGFHIVFEAEILRDLSEIELRRLCVRLRAALLNDSVSHG